MKQLHFNRSNNLSGLHDELLLAIPALRQVVVGVEGRNVALPENMIVEGHDDNIWLTVPDDSDEVAIQAIVDAHDASATQRDLKAEARATGATKLKALGLTDDEIVALQG